MGVTESLHRLLDSQRVERAKEQTCRPGCLRSDLGDK